MTPWCPLLWQFRCHKSLISWCPGCSSQGHGNGSWHLSRAQVPGEEQFPQGTEAEPEVQTLHEPTDKKENLGRCHPLCAHITGISQSGSGPAFRGHVAITWLQHRTWPETAGRSPPIAALWQALRQKTGSEQGLPDVGPCC